MANSDYIRPLPARAPVKFIVAITFNSIEILSKALQQLEVDYGKIDISSKEFDFDQSNYYKEEMGTNLKKQFFSFDNLDYPDQLVGRKVHALNLEKQFAVNNRRQVNIDPGYMELAKLVVASTKNFDHRIYLGKGIYGDLQFRYRKNKFVANDWTYPDYKTKIALEFLTEVRSVYYKQLKNVKSHLQ